MKILVIHYRYYIEGGPERYLFNIKDVFEKKGHEVIPFSLAYPESVDNQYLSYFPKPVIEEFHLSKAKISFTKKVKSALNYIYNKDAKEKLKQLIKDTKPDIAYVLIYSGKLTYSVIEACKEMKVPVVHRISEFYHYCVKSSFFREGKICTECLDNPKACIQHKCVHNSKAKSILNYYAELKEKKSGIRNYFSQIICPSSFTQKIYQKNNIFKNATIHHIPTLFNFSDKENISKELFMKRKNDKQICYIGRVCQEKGIDTLIDAFKKLSDKEIKCTLHLTGCFDDEYGNYIKQKINDLKLQNVMVYGFLPKEKTFEIINNSFISIIPSIWYDNMPNSFIESQAYGLPVIASDIGSLTELVEEGINGYLFTPDNSDILADEIIKICNMSDDEYIKISENSLQFIKNYCSKETHYEKVIEVFKKAIEANK